MTANVHANARVPSGNDGYDATSAEWRGVTTSIHPNHYTENTEAGGRFDARCLLKAPSLPRGAKAGNTEHRDAPPHLGRKKNSPPLSCSVPSVGRAW